MNANLSRLRSPNAPSPPGPGTPGAAGVHALIGPLRAALDGTGPAIAPIPVVSAAVSNDYVQLLLDATQPDDDAVPLESDDIAVVVATSGSTGNPRGVLLTAQALTALTPAVVAPSADPQWIAALPLTSMGGLNVLVRSLAATHEPIALASIGGAAPFTPTDFVRAVDESRNTDIRVSLVAAQVRRLLADPAGTEALQRCTQVLVGAGPTPTALLEAAQAHGIALTVTYGATETAGGCVYDGVALPGVGIALEQSGEITLTGPMLASGYRNDPVATAERFGPSGFHTRDLGLIDGDRLTILGRIDDVVIVNGVNVSPGAVERAIETLPGVGQAVVVEFEDAGASTLAALVLVTAPHPDLGPDVRTHVERHLGRAAMPRKVAAVHEFPVLPNGKTDRSALRIAIEEGRIAWLP